jgi:acetyl-CoA carboxylase alpha subunit
VSDQIAAGLKEMDGVPGEELLRQRRAKFLAMGRNI